MDDEPEQRIDLAQDVINYIQFDIDNIEEGCKEKATLILGRVLDDILICDSWYNSIPEKRAYFKSVTELLDIYEQELTSSHSDVFFGTKAAAFFMHELWKAKDLDAIGRVVEYARRISKTPLQHADCYKNIINEAHF